VFKQVVYVASLPLFNWTIRWIGFCFTSFDWTIEPTTNI